MHLGGFNGGTAVAMLKHYSRDMTIDTIRAREHIDAGLSHLNYNLAPDRGDEISYMLGLLEGVERDPRAYELVDWIVTTPRDYDGDKRELLARSYDYLEASVGRDNVVSAYVHADEPGAELHMHFAAVPRVEAVVMTNDRSRPLYYDADGYHRVKGERVEHRAGEPKLDSRGFQRYERVPKVDEDGNVVTKTRIAASQIWDLRQRGEDNRSVFHREMEDYLCRELGRDHVGILLNEQDAEQAQRRAYSRLDHDDYVKVTAGRDLCLQERERAERERDEAVQERDDAKSQLASAQERLAGAQQEVAQAETRLECLRQGERELEGDNRSLGERVEQLQAELGRARAEHSRLEELRNRLKAAVERLRERLAEALERVRGGRQAVEAVIERFRSADALRERFEAAEKAAGDAAERLGPPMVSLATELKRAQERVAELEPGLQYSRDKIAETEASLEKHQKHALRYRAEIAREKSSLEALRGGLATKDQQLRKAVEIRDKAQARVDAKPAAEAAFTAAEAARESTRQAFEAARDEAVAAYARLPERGRAMVDEVFEREDNRTHAAMIDEREREKTPARVERRQERGERSHDEYRRRQ